MRQMTHKTHAGSNTGNDTGRCSLVMSLNAQCSGRLNIAMLCTLSSDVNECESDNGGCEVTCVNTEGSFRCECPPGSDLDDNGLTCSGQSSIPCV